MKLYRRKTPIISAEQYLMNKPLPLGVEAYQKEVPVFDQFDSGWQTHYRVKTALGTYFNLNHGDWILWNKDGVYTVMADADFKQNYVEVADAS